jgi:hypothetical protein
MLMAFFTLWVIFSYNLFFLVYGLLEPKIEKKIKVKKIYCFTLCYLSYFFILQLFVPYWVSLILCIWAALFFVFSSRMRVVGLTGGIACGKTTVANVLE